MAPASTFEAPGRTQEPQTAEKLEQDANRVDVERAQGTKVGRRTGHSSATNIVPGLIAPRLYATARIVISDWISHFVGGRKS
jgi:hypothetical protein